MNPNKSLWKKNIGLVNFGPVKSIFKISSVEKSEGYVLKKVLLSGVSGGALYNHFYPEAEMVQELCSITEDKSIDLIMVTGALKSHTELFDGILKAGKNLRIVD